MTSSRPQPDSRFDPVQDVEGVVQHYAWGDRTFIPTLLGIEPDGRPWAELWLGTHPSGPAHLRDGRPLSEMQNTSSARRRTGTWTDMRITWGWGRPSYRATRER